MNTTAHKNLFDLKRAVLNHISDHSLYLAQVCLTAVEETLQPWGSLFGRHDLLSESTTRNSWSIIFMQERYFC